MYLLCNAEIMVLVSWKSRHKMVVRWDPFNTVAGWMSAFYGYRIMGKRMERTPGGLGDDRNNKENVIISSESYRPSLRVFSIQQSSAGLWGKVEVFTPRVSEEREYRLSKLAKPAHQVPGVIFEIDVDNLYHFSSEKLSSSMASADPLDSALWVFAYHSTSIHLLTIY
jgi:hypothetical protein